jgi:hypothetical protein
MLLLLGKSPITIALGDIVAVLVNAFLNDLEKGRSIRAGTSYLRLTANYSYFYF